MNNDPIINYIEGLPKIKEYFSSINDQLQSGQEVLVFGARAGNPDSDETVDFFLKSVKERSNKGIKTRILFNDDIRDIGMKFSQLSLVEVRYMPIGVVTKTGCDIFQDFTGIMDWSDPSNPKIILIKDKGITESYREYFNVLWSASIAIAELEKKGNFYLPEVLFENFITHSDEKEKVEEEILKILNTIKPRNMLNIGSGFDSLSTSDSFPKSIEKLTFVEKNTSYIQTYRDSKIESIQADYETWESNTSYDVILASHVLFYFADKQQALQKILSELNPGGIAIFVVHKPDKDYKTVKDLVFGLKNAKYEYTYQKLISAISDLKLDYKETDIDCNLTATDSEELYKVMRLWFEMDLKTYYKYEKEIKDLFKAGTANYTNSIVLIQKQG